MLEAAGVQPTSVSVLPDRGSHVLGLAAAEVLALPALPFDPERADTVVVAYDLNDVDPEISGRLFERTPGQILHEHDHVGGEGLQFGRDLGDDEHDVPHPVGAADEVAGHRLARQETSPR
ncbi:hypothetical protein [Streptomyces sp. P17]|uniref:hypothetical protein n=1 Tax=Streptomyces sp. P17 TaxID=3074716 RepID=UPI0028F43C10|nr:hypothetical protein [Streptomyces sp. P17]MDT9699925.1 hypothetical protein [Streptomyces sp. P17]